ncbi:hypothetical protein [Mycobacterium hubeiense]|uniref:hypothetical protein n=1 Tax=Mycobacterium hubeiense TaxID=1867256 RepID=UPI00130452A2|nr:hypothetical protein [Mycobacterium sp. QGD 101]
MVRTFKPDLLAGSGGLVTVITVEEDGIERGLNAWPSNDTDTRKYNRQEDDDG